MSENPRKTSGRSRGGKPHPVDVHVGGQVRLRRKLLGMSQEKLAEAIGLTFQQVQKYERGTNRIGASRLFELSRVLNVPVEFFYEGVSKEPSSRHGPGSPEGAQAPFEADVLTNPESIDLLRAYYRIQPRVRKKLLETMKSIVAEGDEAAEKAHRGRR